MKTEILEYLEYKYEKISVIAENEHKTIILLRDKDTGEYCRCKRINRVCEVYKQLENIKSEYIPEIFYHHCDGNETVIIEDEIQGKSIQAYIDGGKTFSEKEIENIFIQLCKALTVLHKNGIVHRDLKPDNIMLSGGKINLVDFDASREVKENTLNDTVPLGTKGYAPPEQYGFSQTDSRSDIYALGVTMQHISGKKSRYGKIIKKCVSFAPKDRYKTTKAVIRAIYLRKYRGLLIFATAVVCVAAFSINSYYNDPVFRDDVLLLLRDGGFITLTDEQTDRIFAHKTFDENEIKELWCGKYKSADNAELEIKYKNGLEFSLVTYDNDLKTSLAGGSLALENRDTAVFSKNIEKSEYKLSMFIYENGIFISEGGVSSPYGHGQPVSGYYEKIK